MIYHDGSKFTAQAFKVAEKNSVYQLTMRMQNSGGVNKGKGSENDGATKKLELNGTGKTR